MINRRQFSLASAYNFGVWSVGGPMPTKASTNTVIDNNSIVVAPHGLVNYDLGEKTARVKMGFHSNEQRKIVKLNPSGKVIVNGIELLVNQEEDLNGYTALVPIHDGVLYFEIRRSATAVTRFNVVLPLYKVIEFPKQYIYPDLLKFRIEKPFPNLDYKLIENDFSMGIKSERLEIYSFVQKPNNTSQGLDFEMKPIRTTPIVVPVKTAIANIFRYQRVGLADLTKDYSSGWIVMTVAQKVPIELPM
jgi:hypothetical protein